MILTMLIIIIFALFSIGAFWANHQDKKNNSKLFKEKK